MTMIEKMARAIGPVFDGQEYGEGERPIPQHIDAARAALTALLDPDRQMKDAALAELSDITVSNPKATAWDAVRGYRAMIQAALASQEA